MLDGVEAQRSEPHLASSHAMIWSSRSPRPSGGIGTGARHLEPLVVLSWEGPAIANGAWMSRLDFPFPQIATVDLDIAVVRQLPAANLPLGDDFEPCPVKVIGFEAPFRRQ